MAYSCILGRKYECDGCMCCQEQEIEGICCECGENIDKDENFEYIDGELFCGYCSCILREYASCEEESIEDEEEIKKHNTLICDLLMKKGDSNDKNFM